MPEMCWLIHLIPINEITTFQHTLKVGASLRRSVSKCLAYNQEFRDDRLSRIQSQCSSTVKLQVPVASTRELGVCDVEY